MVGSTITPGSQDLDEQKTIFIGMSIPRGPAVPSFKAEREPVENALAHLEHNTPLVIGRGPARGDAASRFSLPENLEGVSYEHTTITYNANTRLYHVVDGHDGKASTNGTYLQVPGGKLLSLAEIQDLYRTLPMMGEVTSRTLAELARNIKREPEKFEHLGTLDRLPALLSKFGEGFLVLKEDGVYLKRHTRIHLGVSSEYSFRLPRTEHPRHISRRFTDFADSIELDKPAELVNLDSGMTTTRTRHGTVTLLSDKGYNYKPHNEDSALKLDTRKATFLFALDGVGGSVGDKRANGSGKDASKLGAVSVADDLLLDVGFEDAVNGASVRMAEEQVQDALRNQVLRELSPSMMTTIVGVQILSRGVQFANLGDSQGVLFRNGKAVFATREHTIDNDLFEALKKQAKEEKGITETRQFDLEDIKQIQQTVQAVLKSNGMPSGAITRGAGIEDLAPSASVCDLIDPLPIYKGDRIILASDGLWKFVSHEEAAEILYRTSENGELLSTEEATQELFDLAYERMQEAGKGDNITIVVYEHDPQDYSRFRTKR